MPSTFTWGTVTTAGNASTLRLRLEEDEHPLPAPPHDFLVDPATLPVGARVRVELAGRRGRRVIVHGGSAAAAGGRMPAGATTPWAGDSWTMPAGWLRCDGRSVSRAEFPDLFAAIGTRYGSENATTFRLPNLIERVPVGLGGSGFAAMHAPVTGGQVSVTLTTAQMPSHTHAQNAHTHTSAAHTHTSAAHTHGINHGHGAATTTSAGDHTHGPPNDVSGNFLFQNLQAGGTQGQIVASGGNNLIRFQNTVSSAGAHTHNVTVPAHSGNSASTTPGATGSTTPGATGSTTAVNATTGGGEAHPNLQPYVVMHYIIKT